MSSTVISVYSWIIPALRVLHIRIAKVSYFVLVGPPIFLAVGYFMSEYYSASEEILRFDSILMPPLAYLAATLLRRFKKY